MSSNVREHIEQFSDEFLIEQYLHKKHEYTEEAFAIICAVMKERDITEEKITAAAEQKESVEISDHHTFSDDQRSPLQSPFFQKDLSLVHSILGEQKIPFTIDSSVLSPREDGEKVRQLFVISVPSESLSKATEAIEAQFVSQDGAYQIRFSDSRERLKSFRLQEYRVSDLEAAEQIEADFSEEERKPLLHYAQRLLHDADQIEQQSDRVLFFIDNVDSLISRLEDSDSATFTVADLMTILEILQIYCEDPDFPQSMLTLAESLFQIFDENFTQ